MIVETKKIEEFREDGSLRYECTWAYISPLYRHLYEHRRIDPVDGRSFIRTDYAAKYKPNGDLEWKLIYNDYGKAVGDQHGSFRNLNF